MSKISFVGMLSIVLIVLKLAGEITWPWLWVLAPLWIPIILPIFIVGSFCVLAVLFAVIFFFVVGLAAIIEKCFEK